MPLFIGGIADGEFHETRWDSEQWTLRERTPIAAPQKPYDQQTVPMVSLTSDYMRMRFRGLNETYTIFGECHLTPDDVLLRLIQNYRPPQGAPQK